MSQDDAKSREERRRKIRELEASLFGASTIDSIKVDLPELKNVDEYSTNFGKAERQKRYTTPLKIEDYLPKKLPTTSTASKSKSTKSHKQNVKYDDESHLLSDDDDEDQDNYDVLKSMTNKSGRARRGSELLAAAGKLSANKSGGYVNNGPPSSKPGLHPYDPELMDGTGYSVDDPQRSMIENLKKRHGFFGGSKKSDSLDGSTKTGKLTQVNGYQLMLDKAQTLQQMTSSSDLTGGKKQQQLQKGDQDRKFSEFLSSLGQKRKPTSISETGSSSSDSENQYQGSGNSNLSRDSWHTVKKNPDASKSKTSDSSRRDSEATIRDFESSIRKMGTKLSPIRKPSIKIDETPKPARTQPLLREKASNGHEMVNFDHLELPTDYSASDTFRDMPTGALDDLPTDVFDKIPRAVTAREEKRLEQYHKKLDRDRAMRKAQLQSRRESEQLVDTNKISLIATLFTSQTPPRRKSGDAATETDFMFAFFIQQKDGGGQAGVNGSNEATSGTKEAKRVGANNPPPIPRPDPNDPEVGHFCAPFCPGFCEANFCIFHCPPPSIGQKVIENAEK